MGLSHFGAFKNIRPPGVMDDTPPRSRRASGGQPLSQGGLYAIFANLFCCCRVDLDRSSNRFDNGEIWREALPDHLNLQPTGTGRVYAIGESIRCTRSNLLPTRNRVGSTKD